MKHGQNIVNMEENQKWFCADIRKECRNWILKNDNWTGMHERI